MREKNTIKKTIRLRNVWDELIKEYSRRTGLSQISVIEKLLSYGNEQFRDYYGLGEESDRETAREHGDAVRLAIKQVMPKGEELANAYMRKLLFGDIANVEESMNLIQLEPRSIWDKLTRKNNDWQPYEGNT